MKKLLEFLQTKKIVLALGLAGAIAFFGGVYVSAQTEISTDPVIAETRNTTDDEIDPTITTPVVTLVEEEMPVTEEPVVTPVDDPETGSDAVTLEQARVIAEAEHTTNAVKFSKTKQYDGAAVFKFYFTDGWKVYVRESDGAVVRVIDASDVKHDYQNKYWENKEKADVLSAQNRSNNEHRQGGERNQSSHRDNDNRRSQ